MRDESLHLERCQYLAILNNTECLQLFLHGVLFHSNNLENEFCGIIQKIRKSF